MAAFSKLPLTHKQKQQLFTRIHSRLFSKRRFNFKGKEIDGYEVVKQLLLDNGYSLSRNMMSIEYKGNETYVEKDIPLKSKNGPLDYIDLNSLPVGVAHDMFHLFMQPTCEAKAAAASKASEAAAEARKRKRDIAHLPPSQQETIIQMYKQLDSIKRDSETLSRFETKLNEMYPPSPSSMSSQSSRSPRSSQSSQSRSPRSSQSSQSRSPRSSQSSQSSRSPRSSQSSQSSRSPRSSRSSRSSPRSSRASTSPSSLSSQSSPPYTSSINPVTGVAEKRPLFPSSPSSSSSSSSPKYDVRINPSTGMAEKRPIFPSSPLSSPGWEVCSSPTSGKAYKRPKKMYDSDGDFSVVDAEEDFYLE